MTCARAISTSVSVRDLPALSMPVSLRVRDVVRLVALGESRATGCPFSETTPLSTVDLPRGVFCEAYSTCSSPKVSWLAAAL